MSEVPSLGPFCEACQAIPAYGFCFLRGCPTRPAAKLLASAQELLDALQVLEQWVTNDSFNPSAAQRSAGRKALIAARAAIAKATAGDPA